MWIKKNKQQKSLIYMMFITKYVMILFLVLTFRVTFAQEELLKYPSVELTGSQLRTIYSKIVDQEYLLYINLPRNFSDTTKTFPVVYLLDAQWDFPLVSAIYGEQYYDGFLPEMIIVGITWGGKNPNPNILRARDFTPTNVKQTPGSGNAPKFLEFIQKELIPFMELNYRASKNDRVLMGSSYGGLFTLYALFNHTELFNCYVLTSPALRWDNGITYTYEKKYANEESKLKAKIYMAFGEFEGGTSAFKNFATKLKGRNYKGLDLRTRILDGMGHSGGKAEGYTRGLQFVFSKPSLNIDDAILQQYTGIYDKSNEFKINILVENKKLVVLTPDNLKVILQAETKNDFYINGQYYFIHFMKDDSGNIIGLQLKSYGGEEFLRKIN